MKEIVIGIFFCLVIFMTITPAQEYSIEEIQLSGNVQQAYPSCINNNGVVVGKCWTPNNAQRGFIYEDGVMTVIYFSGSIYYYPLSISDNDNFVGTVILDVNSELKGYFNYEFLPPLGTNDSWARDINNSDQIVGVGWDTQSQYMVIYENGQIIHSYPFPDGNIEAINDSGYVTGTDYSGGDGRAFIYNYEENQFNYLPVIGVEDVSAFDINNLNQIVGTFEDGITWVGFIWEGNDYTVLPTKSGPSAINDSGVVVGNYYPISQPNNRAFVYDPVNGMRDLNDLIPIGTGWELLEATDINELGQIVGGGYLNGVIKSFILTPNKLIVKKPTAGELFIAGEVDTIKWIGGGNIDSVKITAVLNWNTPVQSEIVLVESIPGNAESFVWNIPDTLLSYKTKIKIEDKSDPSEFAESGSFRLKGYVLTRVNSDSTYYVYKKNQDQWGFSNSRGDMWPTSWWQQFSYSGQDPFTGSQYSQWQGGGAFKSTVSSMHPDWVSWVNTFSVDACYFSTFFSVYRSAAVIAWKSKVASWNGSCFGIAAANALAFGYKAQFQTKYPNFPGFLNPITVVSDTAVKRVANELFTHQFGNPSIANDKISINIKNPNQTIAELKQILKEDNCEVRSITLFNNSGKGAHTILAYGLKQDTASNNIQYIIVYDNTNPISNNPITVNTLGNGGNGVWSTPDWAGWGGSFNLYLELKADTYLNNAVYPKSSYQSSPFIKGSDVLEINKPTLSSIRIIDNQGNVSGFYNNMIFTEIPGSIPRSIKNGSETPPYGYNLPVDNYSVVINEIVEDTLAIFFFTGNRSFSYERFGADQTDTDRLFFDGGVSVSNPDAQIKTITLLNLVNETTQEKLSVLSSIEIAQNDSIKIENPDSNTVKLISYGTAKDYNIEINYLTETGFGRFGDFNVPLSANTSHTFIPDWTDLTNTELMVLVDIGNDGIIDDTLYLNNTVDVEDQGYLGLPKEYNLAQNYPNPFNPITRIRYSIPQTSFVTIKVYDILGNEVATLANEEKSTGSYEVKFDAKGLSSGIYFYKLQAGSFVETKKMLLLR